MQKLIQTKATTLSYGISDSSTSMRLTNLLKLDGSSMSASDIGDLLYGTYDPGTSREEIFSINGANVTVNSDGTVDITSVVRGLLEVYPYTTGGYATDHPAGAVVVFGNNPQVYKEFGILSQDQTWDGVNTFTESPIVPDGATGKEAINYDQVANIVAEGGVPATPEYIGIVRTTKDQGTNPRVNSVLVRQEATPGATVYVESFNLDFIDTKISFAGDSSPEFTAVSLPTQSRYDLVVIDSNGDLVLRQGTENPSPTKPNPTNGDCVLACVTVRGFIPADPGEKPTIIDSDIELYEPAIYRDDIYTKAEVYDLFQDDISYSAIAGEDITYTDTPIPVYYGNGDSSIIYDNKAFAGAAAQTGAMTVTATIDIGNNPNRILLANIGYTNPGSTTITCVNGSTIQTLNRIGSTGFYYILNPLVGTTTISVAMTTGSNYYTCSANISVASYYNVLQSAPANTKTTTTLGSLFVSFGGFGYQLNSSITAWNSDIAYDHGSYTWDNDPYGSNSSCIYIGSSGVLSTNKTIAPSVNTTGTENNQWVTGTSTPDSILLLPASGLSRQVFQAKANNTDKLGVIGFIKETTTKGNPTTLQALVVNDFTGLTEGETYYLTDAGGISTTHGTNTKIVGVAPSKTSLIMKY